MWISQQRQRSIYTPCLRNSLHRAADSGGISSPSQRKVKQSQELSQRGLIHDIHHTHFSDQEVQDAAPGGHWKTQTQQLQRHKVPSHTFHENTGMKGTIEKTDDEVGSNCSFTLIIVARLHGLISWTVSVWWGNFALDPLRNLNCIFSSDWTCRHTATEHKQCFCCHGPTRSVLLSGSVDLDLGLGRNL